MGAPLTNPAGSIQEQVREERLPGNSLLPKTGGN